MGNWISSVFATGAMEPSDRKGGEEREVLGRPITNVALQCELGVTVDLLKRYKLLNFFSFWFGIYVSEKGNAILS